MLEGNVDHCKFITGFDVRGFMDALNVKFNSDMQEKDQEKYNLCAAKNHRINDLIREVDTLRQKIGEDAQRIEKLLVNMGGKFTPKQKTAVNQSLGIVQSYARAWDTPGFEWPDLETSSG